MVDNRSAGYFGIGGAFNFKSGDISGTAAKLSDDKMGQGGEYFSQRGGEEEGMPQQQGNPYMDQSAVLRATLNSLAMMNVANVLNANKRKPVLNEEEKVAQDLKEILRLKRLQNQTNGHYVDEDDDGTV
jgi:hypothetical protein